MKKTLICAAAAALCIPMISFAADSATTEAEKFEPSSIPHPVAAYLPITAEKNMCIMCHMPAAEGQKKTAGMPSGLPPSHVSNGKPSPIRHECMLCHVEKK